MTDLQEFVPVRCAHSRADPCFWFDACSSDSLAGSAMYAKSTDGECSLGHSVQYCWGLAGINDVIFLLRLNI